MNHYKIEPVSQEEFWEFENAFQRAKDILGYRIGFRANKIYKENKKEHPDQALIAQLKQEIKEIRVVRNDIYGKTVAELNAIIEEHKPKIAEDRERYGPLS